MFDLNKKEKPFTSFSGFGGGGLGLSGGVTKQSTYVDDVFSTFLYNGNSSTQTINNGIDLAGEGGMVWSKSRSTGSYWSVYDTETSLLKWIRTDDTAVNTSNGGNMVTGFTNNGYTIGNNTTYTILNTTGRTYASWTFRKAPGFFDVVTYTGNGTAGRTVAHNLGSVPGMVMIKSTGSGQNWVCFHRSLGGTKAAFINLSSAADTSSSWFNNTNPTSSEFSVGSHGAVNGNGTTYVAYVFAHDDAQYGTGGDESIIKCGTYHGNGGTGNFQNLGFEPQWLLIKNTTRTNQSTYTGWYMFDNMRGVVPGSGDDQYLLANVVTAEASNTYVQFNPTGFSFDGGAFGVNHEDDDYIYMAIRRPNKPPEISTDVFAIDTGNSSSTIPAFDSGFPVDFAIQKEYNTGPNDNFTFTRLTGARVLRTNTTAAEVNGGGLWIADSNVGWSKSYDSTNISYMFKRAPGFMDVVTYTGNLTARTINHNLSAIPELVIVKNRTDTGGASWSTWTSYLPEGYALLLNDIQQGIDRGTQYWNTNSTFTTTTFGLGNQPPTNQNNHNFVGYLFASLAGISKIGTYSGNTGYNVNVDCGFAAGARFVMIKRTDAEVTGTNSSGWYLWDTLRGIVSGNDPYLLLNSNATQTTNTDYVDPLTSGFTVTASAPSSLNVSGGTYLFLAIA